MSALVTALVIFGWLVLIVGGIVLVWDFVTARVLSRPGLAAVVVGVVLIVLANVLPVDAYYAALLM